MLGVTCTCSRVDIIPLIPWSTDILHSHWIRDALVFAHCVKFIDGLSLVETQESLLRLTGDGRCMSPVADTSPALLSLTTLTLSTGFQNCCVRGIIFLVGPSHTHRFIEKPCSIKLSRACCQLFSRHVSGGPFNRAIHRASAR